MCHPGKGWECVLPGIGTRAEITAPKQTPPILTQWMQWLQQAQHAAQWRGSVSHRAFPNAHSHPVQVLSCVMLGSETILCPCAEHRYAGAAAAHCIKTIGAF